MTDAADNAPPVVRPRRLVPRYPVAATMRLRTADGRELEYQARDVSTGGVFLATDEALEIFSDVEVCVALPDGRQLLVPARLVHVLSPQKAAGFGIAAGMGLQFEPRTSEQQDGIARLVEAAKATDPRPRVPRVIAGADSSAVRADPLLSYVLSLIDGERGPEELAEASALDLETTDQMLLALLRSGVIELVTAAGVPARAAEPRSTPSVRGAPAARAAHAQPAPLEPSLRQRLTQLCERMGGNHYAALGLTPDASREQIRQRFFERSKLLHPDAYFGKDLGDDLPQLERAFARVSEAYAVLSRPSSRGEYDAYLAQERALRAVASAEVVAAVHPALPALPANQVQDDAARSSAAPASARAASVASRADQRAVVLRDLHRVLGAHAVVPRRDAGGVVERWLALAESAQRAGQVEEAVKHVQLLAAMQIEDLQLKARVEHVRALVMRSVAFRFEKQALYEEKHQKWDQAARSWLKVCAGRPDDPNAHRRAALATREANGDMRCAVELAKRAVQLAPGDAHNRRALGHMYLAVGMKLNARRELETAVRLSYPDAATQRLLQQLPRAQ
jgi:tetratricopeptide (TPR) repeat protein/Tfp pilus assembly protein PilZ